MEKTRKKLRNVKLNLGRSLNGNFGVNSKKLKILNCSSSITNENSSLLFSHGLQGSVASSLTELETQQPPNRWKSAKEVGEKLRKFLYKMPFVFYDGPNGKKTKAYLLYSFTKREDLKIVCACHADFLTPAQFVKHGGGVDVENPLNHIEIILDY
uniref:Ninja-family protein n=1 Tax=Solanum lycopersicum TaxID=4081 RepID=A0A3Q7EX29_SOLLC